LAPASPTAQLLDTLQRLSVAADALQTRLGTLQAEHAGRAATTTSTSTVTAPVTVLLHTARAQLAEARGTLPPGLAAPARVLSGALRVASQAFAGSTTGAGSDPRGAVAQRSALTRAQENLTLVKGPVEAAAAKFRRTLNFGAVTS
jgi:hypothetical protein